MTGIRRVSQLGTTGESTFVDGSIQGIDIANNTITQNKLASTLSGTTVTTTALRSTVIPSPFEGQMAYLTDTDLLQIWNGTSWRILAISTATSGTVLQTVSTQYSTEYSNNTSTYNDTGITLNITPKSTTSKVLVIATIPTYKDATSTQNASGLRLVRSGTVVKETRLINYTDSSLQVRTVFTDNYLDSPATLSTLTYKYQLANYFNGPWVTTCSNAQPATLTLMEIAG